MVLLLLDRVGSPSRFPDTTLDLPDQGYLRVSVNWVLGPEEDPARVFVEKSATTLPLDRPVPRTDQEDLPPPRTW